MMDFIALHLWQSTLVLIAAWVLALACRRNTAATRYWIWFAASLKFLVPFAWLQWLGDEIGRSFAEPTRAHTGMCHCCDAGVAAAVSVASRRCDSDSAAPLPSHCSRTSTRGTPFWSRNVSNAGATGSRLDRVSASSRSVAVAEASRRVSR